MKAKKGLPPGTPIAYILAYTTLTDRDTGNNGQVIQVHNDYWEIFPETSGLDETPKQQAERRVREIEDSFNDFNSNTVLYSWNIAKVVATSEWYKTGK